MINTDFNWDDLRVVLAICRKGTLSGAAKELRLNHSTVYRRISAIEAKAETRFFDRTSLGYSMTDVGESVFESAKRIEDEVLSLSRGIMGRDSKYSGILRVSAPYALMAKILMPCFRKFCDLYPEIQFDLTLVNSTVDLSKYNTDIVICSTTTPPDIAVGNRLCNIQAAIYASAEYINNHTDVNPGKCNWLMPEKDLDWFSANQWLNKYYPEATVVLRSNTFLSLFEAAKEGIGISFLPCFLGDSSDSLKRIVNPESDLNSELWIFSHSDLRETARVKAFIKFMKNEISVVQDSIEGKIRYA